MLLSLTDNNPSKEKQGRIRQVGILASRVLAFIVYQATARDPLVLGGVVLAMLLVGLVATWIPAQRARCRLIL
jgi:type II secretory pathway component PulM